MFAVYRISQSMHSPLNREGSHAQASYSTPVYMHMRSSSAGSVSPPRAAARTPVRTAQPPSAIFCPSRFALRTHSALCVSFARSGRRRRHLP